MPTVKLNWDEAKEIADILTGTENPNEDYEITENALAQKWNIDIDTFSEIANGIFQMIDFGVSPLTQTPFVGISIKKAQHFEWIAKKEVNQQFITGIISWATEEKRMNKKDKGFVRVITKNNKPEFNVAIYKPEFKIVFENH